MGKQYKDDRIIQRIKRKYKFLQEQEETKYNLFKDYDPFANEISESLLNGNDVAKYALVTGMLEPFYLERLSGVTYSAGFSGNMYYYDQGKNDIMKKAPDKEGFYEIRPNSITYLEIDTMFRVPNYMVLRFNLRVKNVYKGLLLGTGPIIDSGFVGKIFIPLHNLTSNTYRIKKDAKLIEIEFTKISKPQIELPDVESNLKKLGYDLSTAVNLDFSDIPPLNNDNIRKNRDFEEYIRESLSDNTFGTNENSNFVCNSISNALDEINNSKKEMEEILGKINSESKAVKDNNRNFNEEMQKKYKEEKEKIDKSIEKHDQNESIMRNFSVIAIISMLLTAISLGITAAYYFSESSVLESQYSTVRESIDNTDSQVDIIVRALDTIVQDKLFTDTNVQNELNDIINKLQSNYTSTTCHNTDNRQSCFFTFFTIVLVSFISCTILTIYLFKAFKKIKKIELKYTELESSLKQPQITHSEDNNSNEESN